MSRLFSAQLKFWRARRKRSQLELALQANVSPRHLSFLESGRAKPSEEMVLRLLHALTVPLRDQNRVLEAAGFAPRFPEPPPEALPPEIHAAVDFMLEQHEPFPMALLSLDAQILRTNRAATALFAQFVSAPAPDMYTLMLHPGFLRPFITDWEPFARGLISRLHREVLQRQDPRLTAALERVFAFPGIPRAWSQPDFSFAPPAATQLRLERGPLRLGFLIAVTTFSAPAQVTLEELRLESCFPLDAHTREACERLVTSSSSSSQPQASASASVSPPASTPSSRRPSRPWRLSP